MKLLYISLKTVSYTHLYQHGFFYNLVEGSQQVGERPTAAFPSSHVGISTILMIMAWRGSKKLFACLIPFYMLLCCLLYTSCEDVSKTTGDSRVCRSFIFQIIDIVTCLEFNLCACNFTIDIE